MAKRDGVKTAVVGGKNDVPQQYCGTVGGQSTGFSSIDTEIKVMILFGLRIYFDNCIYVVNWPEGPRACPS